MHLSLTCLRADKRCREYKYWSRWLTEAAVLSNRFFDEWDDDPFQYGETASVGFLSGAACKADYISLPEFAIQKNNALGGRKRARGRSDLWVNADQVDWWFEFKQHFISRGSDNDLRRKWEAAKLCARQVRLQGVAVAALVVSFNWLKIHRPEKLADARAAMLRFVADKQYAWCIAGNDEGPETYIIFQIL